MNNCVIALLDALGASQAHKNKDPKVLIKRWDKVDDKLEAYLGFMKSKLTEHNYNNLILKQGPYDNFQIVIPIDIKKVAAINRSVRNPAWWTLHHIAELLIPFFRYSIFNRIFLRGCISVGNYYQTSKGRVFGSAASEAADFREMCDCLGIIAAPSAARVLDAAQTTDRNMSNRWFNIFANYDIPMNNEHYKAKWAINWTTEPKIEYEDNTISNKEIENVLLEEKNRSELRFNQLLNKPVSLHEIRMRKRAIRKWNNTLKFYYDAS